MSNEGIQQSVLDEVEKLAYQLYQKIAQSQCKEKLKGIDNPEGKRVIGFGFFVYHEDGTIATDAVGYWDRDRVQSRVSNFLMALSIKQAQQFSDMVFKNEDGTLKTNAEARPALWEGF